MRWRERAGAVAVFCARSLEVGPYVAVRRRQARRTAPTESEHVRDDQRAPMRGVAGALVPVIGVAEGDAEGHADSLAATSVPEIRSAELRCD